MKIDFEEADWRPLIERVVAETVAKLRADEANLDNGRLCYTEVEAAELLGVPAWSLRDERRDGRVRASVLRGGRIAYTKADLLEYLERRRWPIKKGA